MGISCLCCMYMLLLFLYELCIYKMYLSIYVLYIKFYKSLCVYMFEFAYSSKTFTWHSLVGCWGSYNMVLELQFLTLSLDGPSNLS
jgi:hypothetical protein